MKFSMVVAALLVAIVCVLSPAHAQGVAQGDQVPDQTTPAQTTPVQTSPVQTSPVQTKPTPTKPAPTTPAPTKPAPTKPAPTKPAPTKPAPTKPAPTRPVKEPICYLLCPSGQFCESGTNFCRPPQQANECFNPATGYYQLGCAPGFVCANNKCSYA